MGHPRGVTVAELEKDVPSCTAMWVPPSPAAGVVRVVHADELPQRVVGVRRHLAAVRLLHDVSRLSELFIIPL